MPNKQIHELQPASSLTTEDLVAVSTANGNLTRQAALKDIPVQPALVDTVARSATDRAIDTLTVKDFGAVGDGSADDTTAFAQALSSPAMAIIIPAGRYRLTAPLSVPAGKRICGQGKHVVELIGETSSAAVTLQRGAEGESRTSLEHLSINTVGGGACVVGVGQEISLSDLQLFGGSATQWAIDLVDSRGARLENMSIGSAETGFLGNGIRWRNDDPIANPSNFGDATVVGIDIHLGSPNTDAIHLAGANGGLINNVLIAHARISAPQGGGTPLPNTLGIRLDSTVRSTFIGISLESIDHGIRESGTSNALGASVGNQYIGVSAINVGTAYDDSNASIGRSVQQRTFVGCDNFPATAGLNDGDSIIPAGLWLQSFVSGENAVRLRCFTGHELIIDDGAESGSLSLDVGGSSPRLAPKQAGLLTRLYVGRGSTPNNNTMRDVTIEPVLRLAPRDSENPGATTGQFVYADGVNWDPGRGEGFYAFERGQWRKLAYES